ncbi:MAG: DUF2335 domain-containing protein [Bacteroidales bacterium]|nr:DUF2335 domain-containing protein [Bacteroidales bacterium]
MKKTEERKESNSGIQEREEQLAKAKELTDIVEPIIHSELPDSEKVTEIVRSISIREEYSGPLPTPSMLEGYERILPGAAERILRMAENEQTTRKEACLEMLRQDGEKLKGMVSANKISQVFAFVLVVMLIGVGGILTYLGHTAVGLTIFGTTIISVASTFIIGFFKDRNRVTKD